MRDGGTFEDEHGAVPGALDAGRIRRHIRGQLELLAEPYSHGERPFDAGQVASVVAWWSLFMPLLFTSDLEMATTDLVVSLENGGEVSDRMLIALPWLYATCENLGLEVDAVAGLAEGIDHHSSAMRSAVTQSLALLIDDLQFDGDLLRRPVEEAIRRQYSDSEDAALILLAASGDRDDKRRWAASQLVRYVSHSARLRTLLEAAAEGRNLPNTLLSSMTATALRSLGPFVAVADDPTSRTAPQPQDWPKLDAIRLGGDLWPALVLDRMLAFPFLQATLPID